MAAALSFEFGLASERLVQLEAKPGGYALLFRVVGHPTWVLFSFPTRGRETAARRVPVKSVLANA